MIKVAVRVVYNDLPRITAQLRPRASQAIRKTCQDIERITKESMQGPKTGIIYARGKKPHQASAPGEAPAIDYGVLVNSIQTEMESELRGIVYTNTEYAPVLEFGGARIKPRPFFRPAAEKAFPAFIEAMKQVVK